MSYAGFIPVHVPTNIVNPVVKPALEGYSKMSSSSASESIREDLRVLSKLHGVEHMNMSLLHAIITQFRLFSVTERHSKLYSTEIWDGNFDTEYLAELMQSELTYERVKSTVTDFEKKSKTEMEIHCIVVGRLVNAYRYLKAIKENAGVREEREEKKEERGVREEREVREKREEREETEEREGDDYEYGYGGEDSLPSSDEDDFIGDEDLI